MFHLLQNYFKQITQIIFPYLLSRRKSEPPTVDRSKRHGPINTHIPLCDEADRLGQVGNLIML